ncbi:MAG: histone [Verrucomicrobia bacterium]|nr:histone [Verrucomicrobiota bacterium]
MALKDTINQVRQLLIELSHDLEKAAEGNRAAAQRVRTGSIKFAKVSKLFRKESVDAEKGTKKGKKTGKAPKKAVAKAVRKKKR